MKQIVVLVLFLVHGGVGLRNVRVVFPGAVAEGGEATLLCLYDLQGEQLYSVKWYRGFFEIFRFLPKDAPKIRVFVLPGLVIDIGKSNSHRLTLVGVPMHLGGNYTCEVTAEEPTYNSGSVTEYLQVLERNVTEAFENSTKLRFSGNETMSRAVGASIPHKASFILPVLLAALTF